MSEPRRGEQEPNYNSWASIKNIFFLLNFDVRDGKYFRDFRDVRDVRDGTDVRDVRDGTDGLVMMDSYILTPLSDAEVLLNVKDIISIKRGFMNTSTGFYSAKT